MGLRFFQRGVAAADNLFAGHFVDARILYIRTFRRIPNVIFIGDLDVNKAYTLINTKVAADLRKVYQHSHFDHKEQKVFFNTTLMVLKDRRMIEVGSDYVVLLYDHDQSAEACRFAAEIAAFRVKQHEPVIGFARQLNGSGTNQN